jgi:hypothetical protein
MAKTCQQVVLLHHALVSFSASLDEERTSLQDLGVNVERVRQRVASTAALIEEEIDDIPYRVVSTEDMQTMIARVKNSVKDQKRCRARAEASLAVERSDRVSGRLQALWFARVGLSDPFVPAETLASLFEQFDSGRSGSNIFLICQPRSQLDGGNLQIIEPY